MDEKTSVAFIILIVTLALLFVAYDKRSTIVDLQERVETLEADLDLAREFSENVHRDNTQLRRVNDELRSMVITQAANLSSCMTVREACLEEQPELSRLDAERQQRVHPDDLIFAPNAVMVNVQDAYAGIVAPGGSMLPLLTNGTLVLEVTPTRSDEIYLGDIIIYEHEGVRIIHRVVALGSDDTGWFAIAKGDNNPQDDPWKIRFENVRGIVVGIIY